MAITINGYYYHVATNLNKPGICVLVTRQTLQMILFPFYSTEGNLANAICLEQISLESFGTVYELLAILTNSHFNSCDPVMLIPSFLRMQKSFQHHIEAELDLHFRRLEKKIIELQKKAGEKEIGGKIIEL